MTNRIAEIQTYVMPDKTVEEVEAILTRYQDHLLPNMSIDELLNELEKAVRINNYGSHDLMIQMARQEIKQRLANS